MDNSKINQSELKYSCGAGTASVNLYTGRMLFEHPDIGIGAGSYQIGVSHIYSSQFDEPIVGLPNTRTAYMGKGWKLNVQQFLYMCNGRDYQGFDDGDWAYIDGAGFMHRFVPLRLASGVQVPGVFYDTTGLGLTLTVTGTGPDMRGAVKDEAGNELTFDLWRAVMISSKSGVNAAIEKIYKYDFDPIRLTEIWDGRKPNRKLVLEYNEGDGLLKKIKCIDGDEIKKTINYIYNVDKLVCITADCGGSSKDVAYFSYNGKGLMEYAADAEDRSALKFEYWSNLDGDNNKALKATTGTLSAAENGYDVELGLNSERKRYSFNVMASESFVYNNGFTEVTDNVSVKYQHYYRYDGEPIAVIENYTDGSGLEKFKSVSPSADAGIRLDPYTVSGESFDCTKIWHCNKNTTGSFSQVLITGQEGESLPVEEINQTQGNWRKYTISAWVRINTSAASLLRAWNDTKLTAYFSNGANDFVNNFTELIIDKKKLNCWQYVAKEIVLTSATLDGYSVKLTSGSSSTFTVDVANIRASLYPLLDLRADAAGVNPRDLGDFRAVEIAGAAPQTIAIGDYRLDKSNNFVTEADMLSTLKSMYRSPTSFNFYLNGRRKRIAGVTKAVFKDHLNNSFTLNPNSGNDPYFCLKAYLAKDFRLTTWYMFTNENGVDRVFVFRKALDGVNYPFEKTTYAFDGRLTEQLDEYFVRTWYDYDAYGNLVKAVTDKLNDGDPTRKLVKRYKYDTSGEYLTGETNALGKWITYDAPPLVKESTAITAKNDMKVTSQTDACLERLEKTTFTGMPGGVNNTVEYGYRDGLLSSVTNTGTNGYEMSYNIGYDKFNNVNCFCAGGNHMFSREYEYDPAATGLNTRFSVLRHGNEGDHYTHFLYDKYGREIYEIAKGNVHKNVVQYADKKNMTDISSAAKVRRIQDIYAGQTHEYFYDVYDKEFKGSATTYDGTAQSFEVTKENNNLHQKTSSCSYRNSADFSDYQRVFYETFNDPAKYIRPRLTGLKRQMSNDIVNTQYSYDELGRLTGEYDNFHSIHYTYTAYTDPEYGKVTSLLPYSYETSGYTEYFTYDDNCNILKVARANSDTSKEYVYDKLGRLYQEKTNGAVTGEYTYDSGGNISTMKWKNSVTTYGYDQSNMDRLVSLMSGSTVKHFTYDECGNPVRYKTSSPISAENMTWTRGRLLDSYDGVSFKYNAQGLRTEKTTRNGVTTRYLLDGDRIVGEVRSDDTRVFYEYGRTGVCGIRVLTKSTSALYTYNIDYYNVENDAFGNVKAIYLLESEGCYFNSSTLKAKYEYDAWGNCTATAYQKEDKVLTYPPAAHIVNLNPFRYRGYYWDKETSLYYLNSRYYDPDTGRFINADDVGYLEPFEPCGLNLYSYCGNDPINYYDPSGNSATLFFIGGTLLVKFLIGAAVVTTVVVIETQTHVIEKTVNLIGDAIVEGFNDLIDWIGSWGSGAAGTLPNTTTVPGVGIGTEIGVGISYVPYQRKTPAPRIKNKTRKQARERARKKGGNKPPIHHPNDPLGPHFHPADPRFKHWHYFYTIILHMLRQFLGLWDEYDE